MRVINPSRWKFSPMKMVEPNPIATTSGKKSPNPLIDRHRSGRLIQLVPLQLSLCRSYKKNGDLFRHRQTGRTITEAWRKDWRSSHRN
jgi:hypothetical protein